MDTPTITPNTRDYMLTTIDNPYDPFTHFDEWFKYDTTYGYNTCGLIDRFAHITKTMNDAEIETELERAVNSIVIAFPFLYTKKFKQLNN